jgi:hypothetical protein
MPVTPEHHRAARPGIPWLPLPAILGFACLGLGGSVLLTYTTFSFEDAKQSVADRAKAHIYEARAVPFDSAPEDPAQRAMSISRALTATQTEVRRARSVDAEPEGENSAPVLLADSDRQLRGFNGFGSFAGANTYLAVTGASVGISAQNAPSGFAAPDAETAMSAPVPEASTWMCGTALLLLVAARGARARWHRKRRRD